MGEPATPTAADRAETHLIAEAIVESVRNDRRVPLPMRFEIISDSGPFARQETTSRANVEQLVFRLAQEITLLLAERDVYAETLKDRP